MADRSGRVFLAPSSLRVAFTPTTRPTPGFTTGRPCAQSGHLSGSYVGSVDVEQRRERHVELARVPPQRSTIDAAPTTWRAGRPRDLHRFARRAAGRQHVLDDEHAIALGDDESAPQRQLAVLPLGEHRADAERAADLVTDDDAAERGREHRPSAAKLARAIANRPSQRLGVLPGAAGRARTAGNRSCAVRTSAGSDLRAARPTGGTDQEARRGSFFSCCSNRLRIRLYSSAQLVSSSNPWFSTG